MAASPLEGALVRVYLISRRCVVCRENNAQSYLLMTCICTKTPRKGIVSLVLPATMSKLRLINSMKGLLDGGSRSAEILAIY